MHEFHELFEKTWWGWRMRGHSDTSSPVTLWFCAGGQVQVNATGRWVHSTHRMLPAAQEAAVSLARGTMKVHDGEGLAEAQTRSRT